MGQVMSPTGQLCEQIREIPMARGEVLVFQRHPVPQAVIPRGALLAVTTATGTCIVSGPSCAAIIPAETKHAHRAHVQTAVTIVPLKVLPVLCDQRAAPAIVRLTPLARCVLQALTQPHRQGEQRAALEIILQQELCCESRIASTLTLPTPRDSRLVAVADMLIRYPSLKHELSSLAGQVGASERTLRRLISAELSLSFPQWRTLIRISVSLGHLVAGESVTDTAYSCGFASTSAYIAAFRRLLHETPGEYRAAACAEPLPQAAIYTEFTA